uniref:Uncharacterized protein n=1 Tax=Leersia perrieri TaxID=77586 RepID=A0A0D9XJ70_9ORYZ
MAVPVEITRSEMLRPSTSRNGGERAKLTAFGRSATDGHIPAVFAWDAAAAPSTDAVKGGLAARGIKSRVGVRCSTFQCLLAHAWKKIVAARDLSPEEFTQVRVAVNCRGRANPPVPLDYFGNMVLWAFPRMQMTCNMFVNRDLLSSSYAAVVSVIRDAVARVNEEYIQSFVESGELVAASGGGEEMAATAADKSTAFCPDLEVDSWLGFRFHDLDMGGGPPCAFLPPDLPVEGVLIFVPSCAAAAKDGVELFMALDQQHVEAFRQISATRTG